MNPQVNYYFRFMFYRHFSGTLPAGWVPIKITFGEYLTDKENFYWPSCHPMNNVKAVKMVNNKNTHTHAFQVRSGNLKTNT